MKLKITLLFVITAFSFKSLAQSDINSSIADTVYILFDHTNTNNTVLEVGKGVYYKPALPYPLDIGRDYFIEIYVHCLECKGKGRFVNINYHFDSSPSNKNFYYLEDKKKFLRRKYLDQRWFEDHRKTAWEFFENKVIMLVNPAYLYDDKYYVIRVNLVTHVE